MMSKFEVVKGPLITEKATALQESDNQITIKVDPRANKIEIKKAVEDLFKVKVEKVTTCNRRGRSRRVGRYLGHTPAWKRAVITLAEGSKIDFLETL